ncbi:hypothetical protein HNY73_019188 [Argiope bruennichi]|uniref:DUF7041 domain-containing protein n=1 Tax=Argiope bruennichi TaxID=94029 RepID=A0A8T0EKE3_ARGBR|nr:hypothetical protein HNY73_019188 [Argiope bruennichi]
MMEEISAVKMPNFIPSDPSLWFTMVESTFELAIPKPITASRTKFNYCVSTLPPEIAITVRDIILSPDATDPYSQLKSEIISRCGESKSQEIRKLLAGEQLHDRKPSELLRIMQRRAESHNIADSLLLELFLQQLPSNVQSILASIQPLTPQKASEIADKILDITPNQVSAVSNATATADSELLSEIKMLRKEIAQIRRHSRSHSRNRQPRFRRKSPASNDDICWYHRKYDSKAQKCILPCNYQPNHNGKE